MGERDLTLLLQGMAPQLHAEPYGFAVRDGAPPFQPSPRWPRPRA